MADTDFAPQESIVVADFGHGTSRAFLLEQIGGVFRFVAKAEGPTTSTLPFENVSIGWTQLLRQLEWATGRSLLGRDGLAMPQQESGDGVDALAICSTLAEPARVALLEAGTSPVTNAVLDGLKRAHARVFHVAAPSGRKDGGWAAAQTEALRGFRPEMVILIVGNNPTDSLARTLQIAKQAAMSGSVARAIVVADGTAQDQGLSAFGGKIRVRGISPVVRPAVEIAAEIEVELLEAFRTRLATPDFAELSRFSVSDIISRAHAVDLVNRFIARAFVRRVAT